MEKKKKSEGDEREAEVDREGETKKQRERVRGWFTQRGGGVEEERGEVMRPVTGFTPRLCGN